MKQACEGKDGRSSRHRSEGTDGRRRLGAVELPKLMALDSKSGCKPKMGRKGHCCGRADAAEGEASSVDGPVGLRAGLRSV